MRLLTENHDVVRFVVGPETLLNSTAEGVAVRHESEGLVAEVAFRLRQSKSVKRLLLRFRNLTAFPFASSAEVSFYNVESFTFLPLASGYCLSL